MPLPGQSLWRVWANFVRPYAYSFLLTLTTVGQLQAQPDTLWTSELQGGGNWLDIIRTYDGGYAIGSAQWPGDERRFTNMLLQKTDSLGQSEWLRFIARSDSNDRAFTTLARTLHQMPDNGYLLAGQDHFGALVARTDRNGEALWFKTLLPGEFGISRIESCVIGEDGNIVVVGNDRAVKLDDSNEGEVIWARSYDIRGGENILRVYIAAEGGYVLCGQTTSIGAGAADMYVIKIDEDGAISWRGSYGTRFNEVCAGATQLDDGGWCLAGSQRFGMSDSTHGMSVIINADGEEIWRHVYSEYRRGNVLTSVSQAPNGGFVLGGNDGTASCFLLIRTDSTGEPLWRGRYPGPRGGSHSVISIMPNEDGSYTFGGDGYAGTLLIRTHPDTTRIGNEVVLLDPAFPSQFNFAPPYPNPFNASTNLNYSLPFAANIEVSIVDFQGRQLMTLVNGWQQSGNHNTMWNAEGVPAGTYIIRLNVNGQQSTRSVMLLK